MSRLPTLLVPGSLRRDGVAADETPRDYITAWIRRRMPEYGGRGAALADRVLVVRARTGSGKSTVLPVEIFRILRGRDTPARQRYRGPGVICTQPRVLTAVALANDVSSERRLGGATVRLNPDMVLGVTVGYHTNPTSNRPPTGLIYATAGVLAAQLRNMEDGEIMDRYRVIIVDEAHERTLDGDLLLMLLRNFLQRNAGDERLPFLLLASATFDPARYAEYFGVPRDNIVEVEGQPYAIVRHWPAQGSNDYPAEAAATAVRIHEAHQDDPPDRADILIFMPGDVETSSVMWALDRANRRYGRGAPPNGAPAQAPPPSEKAADAPPSPFLVLKINREVVNSQTGDYSLVFERPDRLPLVGGARPARRVIVSTVVAETGITIDTLRYVIDGGWSRTMEVYPPWGARGLLTRPVTRSRVLQRMGRVGRLFEGDFYPLYTKNVYEALEEQQLPEIFSGGVGDAFLAVVREQQRQKLRTSRTPEFRAEDMALLDPPPPEAFLSANATATALGFVSARAELPGPPGAGAPGAGAPGAEAPGAARGYGLTALGQIGAMFSRTSMEAVRILLAGYAWGAAAPDLVTAAAMFGTTIDKLYSARAGDPQGAPGTPGAEALRAALPSFLVQRTGGAPGVPGALPPSESEAFYYRARLLLADDFAEAILLFDAFARRVDAAQGDLGDVAAWCGRTGLDFAEMADLAGRRETVTEEMLAAGLSPFRNAERRLAVLSADDFTPGVVRLKRCLYDGLRARLLRYDGSAYVSKQGLRVRTPGLLTDALASRLRALHVTQAAARRPRWILTDQVRLMPAPRRPEDGAPPLLYVASTGLVSVLDGYVDPDPDFDGPRVFRAPGDFPAAP